MTRRPRASPRRSFAASLSPRSGLGAATIKRLRRRKSRHFAQFLPSQAPHKNCALAPQNKWLLQIVAARSPSNPAQSSHAYTLAPPQAHGARVCRYPAQAQKTSFCARAGSLFHAGVWIQTAQIHHAKHTAPKQQPRTHEVTHIPRLIGRRSAGLYNASKAAANRAPHNHRAIDTSPNKYIVQHMHPHAIQNAVSAKCAQFFAKERFCEEFNARAPARIEKSPPFAKCNTFSHILSQKALTSKPPRAIIAVFWVIA